MMTQSILNPEVIEQLQFLTEDDPGFVPSLILVLERDTKEAIQVIQNGLAQQDFEAIRKIAHKSVGASGNLGAMRQQLLMREIEQAATAKDAELITAKLKEVIDNFPGTLTALAEIFPSVN
jgi:HPt (histidine-containing phosphotransfer) domain-containing protein